MQDAVMQDTGYKMQDTVIQDAGYLIPDARCRLETGNLKLETLMQDTGFRIQ